MPIGETKLLNRTSILVRLNGFIKVNWLTQLFCKHKKTFIAGHCIDWVKGNHYQKKYIHRCSKCGKEW
jgi:methionyl-tRNA synthetase